MKKSLLLLATMAFATASFAQSTVGVSPTTDPTHLPTHRVKRMGDHSKGDPKTPAQRADKHVTMLTSKLSLTATQQTQVRQILLAQAQEAQSLKGQYPADNQRQARHDAMQAGRAKYQAQLRAVLSPDQYGKLLAMKKDHHKGDKHGDQLPTKS